MGLHHPAVSEEGAPPDIPAPPTRVEKHDDRGQWEEEAEEHRDGPGERGAGPVRLDPGEFGADLRHERVPGKEAQKRGRAEITEETSEDLGRRQIVAALEGIGVGQVAEEAHVSLSVSAGLLFWEAVNWV